MIVVKRSVQRIQYFFFSVKKNMEGRIGLSIPFSLNRIGKNTEYNTIIHNTERKRFFSSHSVHSILYESHTNDLVADCQRMWVYWVVQPWRGSHIIFLLQFSAWICRKFLLFCGFCCCCCWLLVWFGLVSLCSWKLLRFKYCARMISSDICTIQSFSLRNRLNFWWINIREFHPFCQEQQQ